MATPYKAINIDLNPHRQYSGHSDLLGFVNGNLKTDFKRVEEFCSGAPYCQLMDKLFPGSIDLTKVKFDSQLEHEYVENFELLADAFDECSVDLYFDFEKAATGCIRENFLFTQWFKRFFEANFETTGNQNYDALAARNNVRIEPGVFNRDEDIEPVTKSPGSDESQNMDEEQAGDGPEPEPELEQGDPDQAQALYIEEMLSNLEEPTKTDAETNAPPALE